MIDDYVIQQARKWQETVIALSLNPQQHDVIGNVQLLKHSKFSNMQQLDNISVISALDL